MQELYNKYNDKNNILAFPSNNFGFQEPGSNNQIEEFCETNYGIKFQLFEKSDVREKIQIRYTGGYHLLKKMDGMINTKMELLYLVDENGSLKAVYS